MLCKGLCPQSRVCRPALTTGLEWRRHTCHLPQQARLPRQRRPAAARAEKDNKDGKKVDWDRAWSDFKPNVDSLKDSLPKVEQKSSSAGPKFSKQSLRGQRDTIRKQENAVLDVWSQEIFFKIGGAAIVVILFIFVFIIGPP